MKNRRAFTLIEMLIVMLLLTIFVSLVWPTLRSPWGRSKVEDAAEQVRSAMADARREAITSTEPWQFCYRPGTADYITGPLNLEDEKNSSMSDLTRETNTSAKTGVSRESDAGTENDVARDRDMLDPEADEVGPELTVRHLPHRVLFCNPKTDRLPGIDLTENRPTEENFAKNRNDTASDSIENVFSSENLILELGSGEWSRPIVFFPNGRSTTDQIRLRGPGAKARLITIRVRGIIGSVDIDKPRLIQPHDQIEEAEPEHADGEETSW